MFMEFLVCLTSQIHSLSNLRFPGFKGGVFFDVKMSFWTNVVESVCVCRMITKVGALESLHPEDTFSYL